ncbi:glycosyltransferase [Sphingomonas humi]|uniref:Glycosyltransferase n=1 Tax=Sphingomonas humi TaxID=335630 RepID=A0ABP7RSE7_9SPHN
MRVLLVHQNFPGQFVHLAQALKANGAELVAMTMNKVGRDFGFPVVRAPLEHSNAATHPWARDMESRIIRAEAALKTAIKLRDDGFDPDVIVAHPGWGDTLFLKNVWPEARLGIYCEYYYLAEGGDTDFDPEFPNPHEPLESRSKFQLRNLVQRMHFELANGAIAPTRYQANTYPARYRPRIDVIHDGVDTTILKPNADARVRLGSGRELSRADEVITFVARNLDPVRGYHVFMRALPEILRQRPEAQVVIVGGDGNGYGPSPKDGRSWKETFLAEVAERIDPERVHFTGKLAYREYVTLLQLSRLHVYLTYPFVLSWSVLEAMALGAPILASDTEPLREVITDGETGRLFPFFEPAVLAARAVELLGNEAQRERLSAAARAHVVRNYDLRSLCLPRQLAWVDRLYRAAPVIPDWD